MAEVLEGDQVGVAINTLDEESMIKGLQRLFEVVSDPNTRGRCVDAAQKHFSLVEGVSRYRRIYQRLDG